MTDEIAEFIGDQPYEITMQYARIHERRVAYYLPAHSWIPPIRVQRWQNGLRLTVFEFVQC